MQQYVKYGTLLVGTGSSSRKIQYGAVGSMHPYVVQVLVGAVRLVECESPIIVRVAQAQIFPVDFCVC